MVVLGGVSGFFGRGTPVPLSTASCGVHLSKEKGRAPAMLPCRSERDFFVDNLLVRIHLIIEMIPVDRPCAMGV